MLKVLISWWWITGDVLLSLCIFLIPSLGTKTNITALLCPPLWRYGFWTDSPLEQRQRVWRYFCPHVCAPHPGCSDQWGSSPLCLGSGWAAASLGPEWHNPSWFLDPGPGGTEATNELHQDLWLRRVLGTPSKWERRRTKVRCCRAGPGAHDRCARKTYWMNEWRGEINFVNLFGYIGNSFFQTMSELDRIIKKSNHQIRVTLY